MAVPREGADQAAKRRCRLSASLPETPPTPVRTLHTPQPALRSAVVLILLVSGISPSASNASSASVARSAPTVLGDHCTGRQCLHLQGGGSRERGEAVPGQVQPPTLHGRTHARLISQGGCAVGEGAWDLPLASCWQKSVQMAWVMTRGVDLTPRVHPGPCRRHSSAEGWGGGSTPLFHWKRKRTRQLRDLNFFRQIC